MTDAERRNKIAALLAEREGYVRRNLPERVALVNDILRQLGHDVEAAAVQPSTERAVAPKARKRRN